MTAKPKQSGFTIPELLVAVAVAGIASVLIMTAFVYTYGSVVVEQTRANMVRSSQVFLRRMVEDIRLSDSILTNNSITDPYSGTWTTSDPANILVATFPATDNNDDFVNDVDTGDAYFHEVVYFGDSNDNKMYRRLLKNPDATTSVQEGTCPAPNSGCARDIEIVENLENMLFEFYDINDDLTTVPEDARSLQITINLVKQIYGQEIRTTNTTRITLRNV